MWSNYKQAYAAGGKVSGANVHKLKKNGDECNQQKMHSEGKQNYKSLTKYLKQNYSKQKDRTNLGTESNKKRNKDLKMTKKKKKTKIEMNTYIYINSQNDYLWQTIPTTM